MLIVLRQLFIPCFVKELDCTMVAGCVYTCLVVLGIIVNLVYCATVATNNDEIAATNNGEIAATNNAGSAEEYDTFQECMLYCLDKDLCCSCKESGKALMNAAMINELSKTCAISNLLDCSKTLVNSWVNKAERSGANWCVSNNHNKTEQEFARCINQCSGKPLSNPLHVRLPYQKQDLLTQFSDLSNFAYPAFSSLCNDDRTGNILCTEYNSNSFTAAKELCRRGHHCGYHGYSYYWCYTYDSWDYCCTGSCGYGEGTRYRWCHAGSTWQYCK